MSTTPKALELAGKLEVESDKEHSGVKYSTARQSAAELRRQHGEIEGLRAQVEALTKSQEPMGLPEHETPEMRDAVMELLYTGVARSETDLLWQTYRLTLPAPQPLTRPAVPASAIAHEAHGYVREGATAWDRENLHDCIDRLAASAAPNPEVTRPTVPDDETLIAAAIASAALPLGEAEAREYLHVWRKFAALLLAAAPQPEAAQKGGD